MDDLLLQNISLNEKYPFDFQFRWRRLTLLMPLLFIILHARRGKKAFLFLSNFICNSRNLQLAIIYSNWSAKSLCFLLLFAIGLPWNLRIFVVWFADKYIWENHLHTTAALYDKKKQICGPIPSVCISQCIMWVVLYTTYDVTDCYM